MERIKTFDELTIRDNFLFQHVMRNEQLCTHLIEKIVGIKVRSLHYQAFEKTGRAGVGDKPEPGEPDDTFIDLYAALAEVAR